MKHLIQSLIISIAVIGIAAPSFAGDDREDRGWDRDKKEKWHYSKTENHRHNVPPNKTINVNVVNTPGVTVENDSNNPVPVTVVEPIAVNTPWAHRHFTPFEDGTVEVGSGFTVPCDKRLVIEMLSTRGDLGFGELEQVLTRAMVSIVTDGNDAEFTIKPSTIPGDGVNRFSGTERVRLYPDPCSEIVVGFERSSTAGEANMWMSFSGFLIPLDSLTLFP